ncbi:MULTISPECIES: hypothetical protein [unclassified Microcoleus]|uniref:hypothetical protein n=1 Tax=unclassified Microcoleus TaxID=2642155 RepID=UPI002FD3A2C3
MASIDGNGSTKANATTSYFPRIPILAPRYIRLDKRGIFRVAVEEKFGSGLCTGFNGCNSRPEYNSRLTGPKGLFHKE